MKYITKNNYNGQRRKEVASGPSLTIPKVQTLSLTRTTTDLGHPENKTSYLAGENDGLDNQYSDGLHGCEVPSEDDNFGSVFVISEKNLNFY